MHSYRGRFDIISEYNYNCICNYAILCHELRAKHAASCSNIVDKINFTPNSGKVLHFVFRNCFSL